MKDGWQTKKLAEVCDIVMGTSPPGDTYNTTGEGVPLINGPVEFSPGSFGKTIRSKFTTAPNKLCRENDIILCVRGSTTGKMNIAAFDACIWRGVAAIRAKQYQPWINHFISSKTDEIHDLGTGATFPNISTAALANLPINVPPLAEQQRIVGILDEAFEGIATVKANAEKNLQNARALFETIGVVRLIETDVEFSIFVSVALIKPVLRELGPYLVYALRASCVQSQIVPQGAALKHLYLVDLRRLGIPLPPLSEQNRIVARLDSLAEETQRLATIYERKLAALDDLKKSLLHRAFSGQWIMEN